jgi:hypothetical protein
VGATGINQPNQPTTFEAPVSMLIRTDGWLTFHLCYTATLNVGEVKGSDTIVNFVQRSGEIHRNSKNKQENELTDIWDSHGDGCEDYCLLECNAV